MRIERLVGEDEKAKDGSTTQSMEFTRSWIRGYSR